MKWSKERVREITLWVLICMLASTVAMRKQHYNDFCQYEAEIAFLQEELAQERNALIQKHEYEVVQLMQMKDYGGDISLMEKEAEFIAKVIYGIARHLSPECQRAVVWCILNRVESAFYPNSVIEVCEQAQQWMGYSSDNPVVEELYNLALEELKIWYKDGHRPMSNEYLYLSWSSSEIILRDTFEEGKYTHYWRVK